MFRLIHKIDITAKTQRSQRKPVKKQAVALRPLRLCGKFSADHLAEMMIKAFLIFFVYFVVNSIFMTIRENAGHWPPR
jgi:hypothetical protein